jgi:hypothetical protein
MRASYVEDVTAERLLRLLVHNLGDRQRSVATCSDTWPDSWSKYHGTNVRSSDT